MKNLNTITMKNVRNGFLTLLLSGLTLMSCQSNEDEMLETNETSETARIVTKTLATKIAIITSTVNAATVDRNLNADFGFKFSYPITLSYNNGTELKISNSAELLTVIESITDSQYINNIKFPFDVKTVGGDVSLVTESDFNTLINRADTDGDGTPNYQDTDDDGDGIADTDEDTDNDGDTTNDDSDGDGVNDSHDNDNDGDGNDNDSDGDGNDNDNDGDGNDNDNDGDGNDNDSDGDGNDNDDNNDNDDDDNDGN